ncbi:MAG: RDD family protein [Cellvibrionales bacterium]|nr:RDD family protein [Cellvibrionales bacterium]
MLPNAPLWRRLGALIYDSFLLFGLLMLFGGIAVGIESWLFGKTYVETSSTAGGNPLLFVGMLLVVCAFYCVFGY